MHRKIFPNLPFTIGTTSFIKWKGWQENVRYLAGKVDLVQILLLEDAPQDQLPSKSDIQELASLKSRYNLVYSVHLPHRIQLAALDSKLRKKSLERLQYVLDSVSPLDAQFYVLHPYIYDSREDLLKRSLEHMTDSLTKLFVNYPFPRRFGLETLHFNFHHLKDLVELFDTSVVVDVGQAVRYRRDYYSYINTFIDRIIDVHLHGFNGIKDHESLDFMPEVEITKLLTTLLEKNYHGNILLEVFRESDFINSLTLLKKSLKSYE